MPDNFDLMVAPNGARLTKADHPAVPITARELAETARACAQVGATAIHLHVRDAQGHHSLEPGLYAKAVDAIAEMTALRVQFSTEAADRYDVAAQRSCLAHPASGDASVALREIARDPENLTETYRNAARLNVDIQHILYDAQDLRHLLELFETGRIPEQNRRAIFVLGRYTPGQVSRPGDLKPFLDTLGQVPLNWSACAFGQNEHACMMAALEAGGQVRIGFENNHLTPVGTAYPDNAASVAAFVETADKAGFQPRSLTA